MCLDSVVNISIVDKIANFKMPLIYETEYVSIELNNSKIRFRKLPVILIEKICSVVDIHWITYERYSEISIKKYSRYPSGSL
jgi:hypothetical protein